MKSTVYFCKDLSPEAVLKLTGSEQQTVTFGQKTFRAIYGSSNYFEYAVFCTGDDEQAKGYCQLAYIALNDAKNFYEEKHDRGTFVKNIIMDNILPGDIYIRAKELHFATEASRAVFLVRQLGHADVATVHVLSGLFPDKMQDFVLSINETDIAVVKQISGTTTSEELEKMAERLYAARLLLEGKTYNQVMEQSDISSATLSRVSRCVQYGTGYSNVLKKK